MLSILYQFLYSFICFGTESHCVVLAGLELLYLDHQTGSGLTEDRPVSTSWVLRLKACATPHPILIMYVRTRAHGCWIFTKPCVIKFVCYLPNQMEVREG